MRLKNTLSYIHKKYWLNVVTTLSTNFTTIMVIAILFAGSLDRVISWSHLSNFQGDEGVQLLVVDHLMRLRTLPLSGEISAIDADSQYLIHNSPLGYFFQSLLYLASGFSALTFSFWYVIINIICCWISYKIVRNISGKWAGIMALFIMCGSSTMMRMSNWTSQPSNATFFQLIGLWFFVKAYKQQKIWYWATGTIAIVTALSLYPPQALFLPIYLLIQVVVTSKLAMWNQLMLFRKTILPSLVVGAYVLMAALLFVRIEYSRLSNIETIYRYISSPAIQASPSTSFNIKLRANLLELGNGVSWNHNQIPAVLVVILILAGLIGGTRKKCVNRYLSLSVGLTIAYGLLIVSLLEEVVQPPYLHALVPLVVYSFCLLPVVILKKQVLKRVLTAVVIIYVLNSLAGAKKILHNFRQSYFQEQVGAVSAVAHDLTSMGETSTPFSLYAVSNNSSWNWEGSIFWYLLEKKLGKTLVTIDQYSSKATPVFSFEPQYVYVFCINPPGNEKLINKLECLQEYFSNGVNSSPTSVFISWMSSRITVIKVAY